MFRTILLLVLIYAATEASPAEDSTPDGCRPSGPSWASEEVFTRAIDRAVSAAMAPWQRTVQNLTKSLDELMQAVAELRTASVTRIPTTPSTQPLCDIIGYHYTAITGSCYKLHKEEMVWPVAESACRDEGARLAVVDSRAEALILGDLSEGLLNVPFIGVYKDAADQWRTVTGKDVEEAAGYRLWRSGEPASGDRWRYAVMSAQGTISTRADNAIRPFICEKAP